MWFLLLVCLLPYIAIAQPQGPDTLWTRSFQWTLENAGDVLWTEDGGVLLVGSTWHNSQSHDLFAWKLDGTGNPVWLRTYGDPGTDDFGGYLAPLPGGNFALGDAAYVPGEATYRLFQLTSDGTVSDSDTYCIPNRSLTLERIQSAPDGRMLLMGQANLGPYVVAVTAAGDTAWTLLLSDIFFGWFGGARPTADGGWIITLGGTFSADDPYEDVLLLKVSAQGEREFLRSYHHNERDLGRDIAVLPDGGYVIVGQTTKNDTTRAWIGWVLRTDALGDTLWTRVFDAGLDEQLYRILACDNGDVVMAGFYFSQHPASLSLTRLSAQGEVVWRSLYPAGNDWFAHCGLDVDAQGRYVLSCSKDLFTPYVVVTAPDPLAGMPQVWNAATPRNVQIAGLAPNPFNSTTEIRYVLPRSAHVTLTVYAVTGREVGVLVDGVVQAGESRVVWDAAGMASGVYFVRLQAGEAVRVGKVLLVQ